MRFSNKTLIILLVILIILSLNFFQKEVRGFFYSMFEPTQKRLWIARDKTADFFGGIFRQRSLRKENQELKLKIQEFLAENSFRKELKKENRALRKALELELQKEFKLKLVKIIGKNIGEDIILVDKGQKDSLEQGMPVITPQKVLVGKISKVYSNFSEVKLISHPESSLSVKISERNFLAKPKNRFPPSWKTASEASVRNRGFLKEGGRGKPCDRFWAVMEGRGDLKVKLKLIPQKAEIQIGDLVIVGPNLLIGLIKKIEKSDVKPFQKAQISPFFNLEQENLLVITNY